MLFGLIFELPLILLILARVGIVRVDFETQERKPKSSALWYAGVAKNNTVPARD